MKFKSTRGGETGVTFCEAVAKGLAEDGGLFLPDSLPDIKPHLDNFKKLSYSELCAEFFSFFATDIPKSKLIEHANNAYSNFDHKEIAPLKKMGKELYILELFHGPTLAFKDFALQFLGNLYEEQISRTNAPITVLGATSGDTGAAAIHGLIGKKAVNIFILYPNGRVSPLQEFQMTRTEAPNVYPIAISGSFDDAQNILKDIFNDLDFKKQVGLSAINSINLARILAQCVYYLYSWLKLSEKEQQNVNFIVPSGNFGNVLSGWLIHKMGLPVKSFHIAANQNDILDRFYKTGNYSPGIVEPSLAPSMDIQIASNFERLLYYMEKENPEAVSDIMETIKGGGDYTASDLKAYNFTSSKTNDTEINETIKSFYKDHDYILDPHTACGIKGIKPNSTNILLSTAHPAKFPDTIKEAIKKHPKSDTLEVLRNKKETKYEMAADANKVKAFILEHL